MAKTSGKRTMVTTHLADDAVRAKIEAGIRSAEDGPSRTAAELKARLIAKVRKAARAGG